MAADSARPTPEMQAILKMLANEDAGLPDPTMLAAAEGRKIAEQTNRRWNRDLPHMAETRALLLDPELSARLLTPDADAGVGAICYVHGGGYAFCSMATHEHAARSLAISARAPVVTFDYRLAPEHPYPSGLADCRAMWRAFAAHFAGRRLAIAGDSAGANLALATTLAEGREGRTVPDLAMLFYGCFDCDFETPSYCEFAEGPGLTRAKMMRYYDWYAPASTDRTDPLLSPLRAPDAEMSALPPIYMNAAELDPLRSDSERLHARLRSLGRDDTFGIFPGVVHGFMQMGSRLAAAREAIAEAGDAFRASFPG